MRTTCANPSLRSRKWPRLDGERTLQLRSRYAQQQQGRDDERRGVDPVRNIGIRHCDECAADDRRHGPAHVLTRLDQRVRATELLLVDEVRQTCVDRGPEEPGRDTRDARERNDLPRTVRERQRAEDGCADDVGDDHQAASRQPVEERAEEEADRDGGQELDDHQRADPGARVGSVLDVDDEGHRREERAEAGAEGREKEQAKVGRRAENAELSAEAGHRGGVCQEAAAAVLTRASASAEERVLLGRAHGDADRLRERRTRRGDER